MQHKGSALQYWTTLSTQMCTEYVCLWNYVALCTHSNSLIGMFYLSHSQMPCSLPVSQVWLALGKNDCMLLRFGISLCATCIQHTVILLLACKHPFLVSHLYDIVRFLLLYYVIVAIWCWDRTAEGCKERKGKSTTGQAMYMLLQPCIRERPTQ